MINNSKDESQLIHLLQSPDGQDLQQVFVEEFNKSSDIEIAYDKAVEEARARGIIRKFQIAAGFDVLNILRQLVSLIIKSQRIVSSNKGSQI